MEQNISPLENIFSFITISLSPVYNVMPKIDVYCLMFREGSRHATAHRTGSHSTCKYLCNSVPCSLFHWTSICKPQMLRCRQDEGPDSGPLTSPAAPDRQRVKALQKDLSLTLHPTPGFPWDATFSSNQKFMGETWVPKGIPRATFQIFSPQRTEPSAPETVLTACGWLRANATCRFCQLAGPGWGFCSPASVLFVFWTFTVANNPKWYLINSHQFVSIWRF